MNATDQSGPRPTITGAFFALFQAVYVLFTDLLGGVFRLVTPWNAFILVIFAFCLYLVKLFWHYLCDDRHLCQTKAYTHAVRALMEMRRVSWEMCWFTACFNTLFSIAMLLIFLVNAVFFLGWSAYCLIGSLVAPLETYTEEEIAELLPAPPPRAVAAPVSVVSSFKEAMGRIRGTPPATAGPANVEPRMRGAASSRGGGGVMALLRRAPASAEKEGEAGTYAEGEDLLEDLAFKILAKKCRDAWKEHTGQSADAGTSDVTMDSAEPRARPAAPLKARKPFPKNVAARAPVPKTGKRGTDSNGGGGVGKKIKGNSGLDARGSNDDEIMEEGPGVDARDSDGETMEEDDDASSSGGEGGMAD